MIELMQDLPANVLGFSAHGKITGADYESTLIPAVEAKLKETAKVALLYHLGSDFQSFEAGALWQDTKVGLMHLTAWRRIAVVTDSDWLRGAVKALGFMMPCPVKVFATSELADAKAWVSE